MNKRSKVEEKRHKYTDNFHETKIKEKFGIFCTDSWKAHQLSRKTVNCFTSVISWATLKMKKKKNISGKKAKYEVTRMNVIRNTHGRASLLHSSNMAALPLSLTPSKWGFQTVHGFLRRMRSTHTLHSYTNIRENTISCVA
ncbi:uncharacterized protein LOC123988388 isoform X2 [Osmia bicornis bicornis]|nr:uncharacterized protein LOC123988388 isoform X2 [Osmia bicornis bicornis]XP_046144240.1 uncharacterized protein LOC123988388 isoform X2 [Osmia bicornis bicornis]